MIKHLEIENFILIEKQVIELDKQINVLTGDTGSGKSVIINSIRFIFGMRANSDLFFDNTKNIKITATLDLNPSLKQKLIEHQIEVDEEVEIMRVLSPAGKNKIRINGELVSVGVLQEIFEDIITVYSQYSVAKFKSDNSYLQIIDSLIADKSLFESYKKEYTIYQHLVSALEETKQKALLKGERQELLELRLKDLKDVDNEENINELIDEKTELDNSLLNHNVNNMASVQFDTITTSLTELVKMELPDKQLEMLNDALINIEEVSFEVAKASVPVDEGRLHMISEYISMCRRLARKYNISIEQLADYKQELQEEFDNLDGIDADIDNLDSKLQKQTNLLFEIGQKISELRQSVAAPFAKDVNHKLKQLSLVESDFKVDFQQVEIHASGIDKCSFNVRMNEGSDYTLIHKTASGGEIARFLLALEAVVSSNVESGFIIFDEIDTGVSGHVATEMANMMKQISENHKLLIVTHLAQVAAVSQNHFVISKASDGSITKSSARLLTDEEKPEALAKMISGAEISKQAILHAETLLEQK